MLGNPGGRARLPAPGKQAPTGGFRGRHELSPATDCAVGRGHEEEVHVPSPRCLS